ncbi:MAG TPA: hypothetical protein VIL74_21175 [Pyrinomonadaceae bacterium]|jgi:hypothetical protein
MPKDPPRNQPNYKIGGDHINEYEYQNNKNQITEEEDQYPRPKTNAGDADSTNENNQETNRTANESRSG